MTRQSTAESGERKFYGEPLRKKGPLKIGKKCRHAEWHEMVMKMNFPPFLAPLFLGWNFRVANRENIVLFLRRTGNFQVQWNLRCKLKASRANSWNFASISSFYLKQTRASFPKCECLFESYRQTAWINTIKNPATSSNMKQASPQLIHIFFLKISPWLVKRFCCLYYLKGVVISALNAREW